MFKLNKYINSLTLKLGALRSRSCCLIINAMAFILVNNTVFEKCKFAQIS